MPCQRGRTIGKGFCNLVSCASVPQLESYFANNKLGRILPKFRNSKICNAAGLLAGITTDLGAAAEAAFDGDRRLSRLAEPRGGSGVNPASLGGAVPC